MRILYYHNTLGDGAEGVHIRAMIRAFRQLEHEVHLVSVVDTEGGGRIPGKLSRWRRRLPRWLVELGEIALNLFVFQLLWRTMRSARPDMLYVRHTRYSLAPMLVARLLGVPTVLEVNSVYSMLAIQQFEPISWRATSRLLERWACRSAQGIVTVSTALKEDLESLGVPAANVTVLPNGVDGDLFRPSAVDGSRYRERLRLQDKVVLGYSGSLRAWQGLDLLIKALEHIDMAKDKLCLLILGDGPERLGLEQMIRRTGLRDSVTLLGNARHEDVPAFLEAIDIGVLPAERRYHACPMKVIEYMAMGRPVVAPRQRNIEELVSDRVEGLLFEPESVESLRASLLLLSRDTELRSRMGARALKKATGRLTWKSNAMRVIEMIEGLPKHASSHR